MITKFMNCIIVITLLTILGLVYGCSNSTWSDAQQANTYEAYQNYIADNPDGENIAVAKQRADSLYWHTIKTDTAAKAFEGYLKEFPDGQYRLQAQSKLNNNIATKARVTGSNVIIRSDHTTASASAGVVAKEGTVVQILDRYNSGNSSEAILKREITITYSGNQIRIPEGKALNILDDRSDSVRASFSTPDYGATQATISKNDIEAMGGERWYKIRTHDDITGWIYGKFIEEM